MHEYLNYKNIYCNYGIVTVKSYNKDNKRSDDIFIDMSEYIKEQLEVSENILIIDDVFDTGHTMMNLCNYLVGIGIYSNRFKTASVYYKPIKNETTIIPDFYIQEREEWIVFPHEFVGLSEREVEFKLRE